MKKARLMIFFRSNGVVVKIEKILAFSCRKSISMTISAIFCLFKGTFDQLLSINRRFSFSNSKWRPKYSNNKIYFIRSKQGTMIFFHFKIAGQRKLINDWKCLSFGFTVAKIINLQSFSLFN